MVTLAVPGPGMRVDVIVACNCVLLKTWVLRVVPLTTMTEDETMSLPVTVRINPARTSAKVTVLSDRDAMTGAGRALPHRGLSALQPCRISTASSNALSGRKEELCCFILHRTPEWVSGSKGFVERK